MINVAFCDDDISVREELADLLERYRGRCGQDLRYSGFGSPLELMAEIERGKRFDVLFLDILMPGENGIETAAEVRGCDSTVKIIFLTSSSEFALQSYAVGAYYYQLKPLQPERFFQMLDTVIADCEKEQRNGLILRCKDGIARIEPRQIVFCEVIYRTLFFHLSSGRTLECSGSMEGLNRQLAPYKTFYRVHRSYLINWDFVQHISHQTVTMFGQTEVPIPRGKYSEIKNRFLEYAFQRGQTIL